MKHNADRRPRGISRRNFLQVGATAGAGVAVAGAATPAWAGGRNRALRVGGLRVGAMRDSLGIQDPQPQLSWLLAADGSARQNGHRQSAYQIVNVPIGSTATIRLPGEPDRAVPSGEHRFRVTLPT